MPRFNCQHPDTLHLILTNPAAREASIAALMAIVRQYGYEGINLDFEGGYADDRDDLTRYANRIGRRLHGRGKEALARGVREVGRLLHVAQLASTTTAA